MKTTQATPIQTLASRSLASVWHPCTQMQQHEQLPLVALARGEGAWLIDTQGRRLLDGISSWWVNLFGHANPRINAAIVEQLNTLEHAMLAGFTHEPVVALSERLSALTGNVLGHCFYASDGASAVEIALKMSAHAWRNQGLQDKQEFVCLAGSYHGETLGALGVTDVPVFSQAYGDLFKRAHVVMSPDARQAGANESAQDVARRAAAALEKILQTHAGKIAALIVEPLVQCATGMAMHDPLYLQLASELCARHQVHLIFDEIAVGFGRTGTFFACEQAGVWPDLLCLSKGISGGYLPLSLVMCKPHIYQAFYDKDVARGFLHSHSYTGNPLACRAALATLDIFEDQQVLAANRILAGKLAAALAPLAGHARVRNFRQQGMILAFDVADADAGFARRMFAACLERGLLLRPIGGTVYVMPPYILSFADVEHLGRALQSAFDAALEAPRGSAHASSLELA